MTTTNDDEVTGTVSKVISLPDGKWRLNYQKDGVEGLTATQPLNSDPGVEPGDRIRIHSNPPNPLAGGEAIRVDKRAGEVKWAARTF